MSFNALFEPAYVIDTHPILWHLVGDRRLSSTAANIIRAAEQSQTQLVLSAVVMAELYYANQKKHYFTDFGRVYQQLTTQGYIRIVPFQVEEVLDFDVNAAVPEMHDRIIAGLARRLGVPLVTADPLITAAQICRIVW